MKNYSGKQFGKWKVICFHETRHRGLNYWNCQCECGTERSIRIGSLLQGGTTSCGLCGNRGVPHGLFGTSIYYIWCGMKSRCLCRTHRAYKDYGGRGIQVCEYLQYSPRSIINLIGERPSDQLSIDRRSNKGHYSCGSCQQCLTNGWPMNIRWATDQEQQQNMRSNRWITHNGETKIAAEWARDLGLKPVSFYKRLRCGKKGEALFAPPNLSYKRT